MIIQLHATFKKSYKKRIAHNTSLQERVKKRIRLFQLNPQNPILRTHQLTGKYRDYYAFSVTGDVRIVFEKLDDTHAMFIDIGSHNQVY